ncbi:MAG TPA: CocE/NonD family hydrolase [Candidatus Thermoplasmatota archaeon]|nr:CocE/NonD family hydrolase [Candidatus Thermoplasmatota archaeon]
MSFDGTIVPITVYRPAGASAGSPVPIILHSHGWGGSRITDGSGIVGRLWGDGLGVITIDERGHGESQAIAEVHHKDFEVKDTIAVLDYAATLDWVAKEPASGIPNDIIAGGAGYSYAGGMQLTAASHDRRLDAIAPEITWTDLPYSLAPEHAPKSVWLDALIGLAKQGGVRYDPRIDDWYAAILLTGEVPQEALDHFEGSSPVLANIDADVLFIQGMPDVLFNANNALRGYEALNAKPGQDVRLFTHLTGHVLPSLQPLGTTPARAETFQEEGPCGVNADVIAGWLEERLMSGPASGVPEISFALDDGECVTFDALPTGALDVAIPAILVPEGAGSVALPVLDGPALLAGIPHLRATGTDGIVVEGLAFAGLVILSPDGHERIVDDQTQPIRLVPGEPLDLDLVAVAARLNEGDKLLLRIDGLNEWYAHNGQRAPGAALLTDLTVTLPVVEE